MPRPPPPPRHSSKMQVFLWNNQGGEKKGPVWLTCYPQQVYQPLDRMVPHGIMLADIDGNMSYRISGPSLEEVWSDSEHQQQVQRKDSSECYERHHPIWTSCLLTWLCQVPRLAMSDDLAFLSVILGRSGWFLETYWRSFYKTRDVFSYGPDLDGIEVLGSRQRISFSRSTCRRKGLGR